MIPIPKAHTKIGKVLNFFLNGGGAKISLCAIIILPVAILICLGLTNFVGADMVDDYIGGMMLYYLLLFISWPYLNALYRKEGSLKTRHIAMLHDVKMSFYALGSDFKKAGKDLWAVIKAMGWLLLIIAGVIVAIIVILFLGSLIFPISATSVIIMLLVMIYMKLPER